MILEAERLGCVREVLVIAAALSMQDPRERPLEQRAQADQLHARFQDPTLRLPDLAEPLAPPAQPSSASCRSSAFRRMCRREYLNYLRVREWQDFESQLRQVCHELKVELGKEPAWLDQPSAEAESAGAPYDADGIHQALLSGPALPHRRARGARAVRRLPASGQRGPREYLGARGTRFAIFPGSGLCGKNPPYLMAGELVETSRLWARQNAAIKPEWAEQLGGDLVKRHLQRAALVAQARRR